MLVLKIKSVLYVVTLLMILVSTANTQVTVYNNFGPGNEGWDYNYGFGWSIAGNNVPSQHGQYGVEQAMAFQSTTDGIIADIWVAISYATITIQPDTVDIRLTRNSQGFPPDTADIMEEWTITNFGSWSQWNMPRHLQGNGTSQLQAGQWYWLWAIAKDTTFCMWSMNIDPTFTCPHTLRREGEDWLNIHDETASVFRIDCIPISVISIPKTLIPQDYYLDQNYPNPFNSSTKISYSITNLGFVTLKIYDVLGREIQTLVSEFQKGNTYSVNFDASKLSSGIYSYRLQVSNDFVETKNMLYLR